MSLILSYSSSEIQIAQPCLCSQRKRLLVYRERVLPPNPEERNEPANLLISLNAVAELKEVSVKRVVEAVVENQRRLFGDLPSTHSGGDQASSAGRG